MFKFDLRAPTMGINAAADKWKWLAINIMGNSLPKLEILLDKLVQAVDPNATTLLLKQTNETISVIKFASVALSLLLIILFTVTIIFLNISIKHRTKTFHSKYVHFQYGGTVETIARTYANLMKFHCNRVRKNGVGIGAEKTNVLLIGANETAEAYPCHDREFLSDQILQSLLPTDQPFVFRTIKDALHTLDICCTSEKKTLFVLLLISTTEDRHEHETFQMPSSLRGHCYAIVGTGIGANGAPAHKLSKASKGPNGELLGKNLPLGPEIAGVCF